jgi:hypothetical protein
MMTERGTNRKTCLRFIACKQQGAIDARSVGMEFTAGCGGSLVTHRWYMVSKGRMGSKQGKVGIVTADNDQAA